MRGILALIFEFSAPAAQEKASSNEGQNACTCDLKYTMFAEIIRHNVLTEYKTQNGQYTQDNNQEPIPISHFSSFVGLNSTTTARGTRLQAAFQMSAIISLDEIPLAVENGEPGNAIPDQAED